MIAIAILCRFLYLTYKFYILQILHVQCYNTTHANIVSYNYCCSFSPSPTILIMSPSPTWKNSSYSLHWSKDLLMEFIIPNGK